MIIGYRSIATVTLRTSGILLLVAALLGTPGQPALAGVITTFGGASGPGLDSMSFNNLGTPSPGNDDVAGSSPNWISINQKAYSTTDYIDMVFTVADSGATATEYIVTEGVYNGTGDFWIGYQVQLGFGTGTGFVSAGLGDGIDFDTPDDNSPKDFTPFPTVTFDAVTINAVDGIVSPGGFHVFTFAIDVPNGITEFTIRQAPRGAPVSTEPTTWGTLKAIYR